MPTALVQDLHLAFELLLELRLEPSQVGVGTACHEVVAVNCQGNLLRAVGEIARAPLAGLEADAVEKLSVSCGLIVGRARGSVETEI